MLAWKQLKISNTLIMFVKKIWHTESFIWKIGSGIIIKALRFWEPYLRFEILRASWLMLTIQTVNTDGSVRYDNNIVAHNKFPAMNHYWTRDYDRTRGSHSAGPKLTLTDQISLGYTATTGIRDWGISVCIDIIIKSISPRIMSHTQSTLGSFSPVIIGLPIPPGFILCDCFLHQSWINAR